MKPQITPSFKWRLLASLIICAPAWTAGAQDFTSPISALIDSPTSGAARMSYSTTGQLVYGPDDRLSLIYWEDTGDSTPANPNHVWVVQWTESGGWQTRQRVDRDNFGARQPTMLLLPGGQMLGAWYDYRDCTAQHAYNDNIEVYGARWPVTGLPALADFRLTSTAALHTGDNSYVPQMARLADGRVALVWYDFHWDPNIGEIALRLSDANGNFAPSPVIDDARLTNAGMRAAGDAGKSFTMPQIATDTSDTLHLTWTTGTNEVPSSLYYGRYNPNTSTWLDGPRRLRTGVRGHYDPPRLATHATTGDVWMTYVDRTTNGNDDVWIQRRRPNAADWDAPFRLTTSANAENYTTLKVAAGGKPCVAYIETAGSQQTLRYLVFDPSTAQTVDQRVVAQGTGRWISPAMALDDNDKVFLVWESDPTLTTSELLFSTNRLRNAAEGWILYD